MIIEILVVPTDGNALVYVTGYLLKKCLMQHSCKQCLEFNELNTLEKQATLFSKAKAYINSEKLPFGGLTVPSRNIVEYIIEFREHIYR